MRRGEGGGWEGVVGVYLVGSAIKDQGLLV